MHQTAETITIMDTITIAARTTVTSTTEMLRLLELVVSEEQEGGLIN
jgi:hypothetical protein